MAHGDVETVSKRGQWVNRVEGEEELSQGFASREEAIEEGRRLAEASGTAHRVVPSASTGVATDEQSGADAEEIEGRMMPETTDAEGRPLENPSGG